MASKVKVTFNAGRWFLWVLVSVVTAMVGYQIHGSFWWAVADYLVAPLPWLKWLIYHQVTWTIIKETFSWFFA